MTEPAPLPDGITISPSMLHAMSEQGIALVLVRADAVRFIYPPTSVLHEETK